MWTRFIDSHLHLQDRRFAGKIDKVIANAATSGICKLFCNATRESDWSFILNLAAENTSVIPFLAIHPWYADSATPGWETRIHDALSSCTHGAGIGETGLDKARPTDFANQVKLFEAHLEIATSLKLPVAVHCTRCWGKLISILEGHAARQTLPQTMIHSFTGSLESMQRLVAIGCYISYSSGIADPEKTKLREIFKQTPVELLFLETDAPDQLNPMLVDQEDLITRYNEPTVITAIYRSAAHQRGIHLEDFAAQIWHNASIYANKALIG